MPSESDEHQIEATMQVDAPPAQTFASGRYVVQRILPEGGQKTVYLVRDTLLERDCALAVIKAKVVEEDDLERLKREAQSLARLPAHPNLVTVYDLGSEDGQPYLVSEYVPGGDLRRELRETSGPLAIDRAVTIAIDVAQALSVAHGQGIIHRDLKPANIWLTEKRSAKLGDFGLAIAMGGSRLTSAGTLLGTAAYVAPEQALGGTVDARSDLYALGIVLYQMVCGHPPFEGGDVLAVISQHVHTTPVEPS